MNALRLIPRDLSLFILIFFPVIGLFIACHPIGFLSSHADSMTSLEAEGDLPNEKQNFQSLLQRTGCNDFKNYVWHYMYTLISMGNDIIYYDHFEETIKKRIKELMKGTSIPQKNIITLQNILRPFTNSFRNSKKTIKITTK